VIVVVGLAALRTTSAGPGEAVGAAPGIAAAAAADGAAVEIVTKVGEDGAGEELLLAFGRAGRVIGRACGIGAVPVEAPFVHIAVHVIQAPGVGFLLADAHGLAAGDTRKAIDVIGGFEMVGLVAFAIHVIRSH